MRCHGNKPTLWTALTLFCVYVNNQYIAEVSNGNKLKMIIPPTIAITMGNMIQTMTIYGPNYCNCQERIIDSKSCQASPHADNTVYFCNYPFTTNGWLTLV